MRAWPNRMVRPVPPEKGKGCRVPAVSVVIPTYKRASVIGNAIASVLGQTFQDFEILVADDASPDDTEKVVRGFGDPQSAI